MRLIGIKLGVCDPLVRKALKDYTWYPFGDYREPTAEKGWEWLDPNQKAQEEACKQMYKSVVEGEKYSKLAKLLIHDFPTEARVFFFVTNANFGGTLIKGAKLNKAKELDFGDLIDKARVV